MWQHIASSVREGNIRRWRVEDGVEVGTSMTRDAKWVTLTTQQQQQRCYCCRQILSRQTPHRYRYVDLRISSNLRQSERLPPRRRPNRSTVYMHY